MLHRCCSYAILYSMKEIRPSKRKYFLCWNPLVYETVYSSSCLLKPFIGTYINQRSTPPHHILLNFSFNIMPL
jgi:hypothetical protein